MKTTYAMALLGLVASFVLTVGCAVEAEPEAATEPTAAAEEAIVTNCATVYTDGNFGGMHETLAAVTANLVSPFLDSVSSVSVLGNCTLTLYTGSGETGTSQVFTGSNPTVPPAFNDVAASYACFCPLRCPPGEINCGPGEGCQFSCF